MRKLSTILLISILAVFLAAGSAMAVPFTYGSSGEKSLQTILDEMTVTPSGASSVNVLTDSVADDTDSSWQITATGSSVATIVIELAGYAGTNSFGVYNGINSVQLFDGAASQGNSVTIGLWDNLDGTYNVEKNSANTGVVWNSPTFGYYLDTPGETFFSDTTLNPDDTDHMVAFQGEGDWFQIPNRPAGTWTVDEYVLAWEDLYNGGDKDYNDFVVMVESVQPIPEPATMLLFGTGLIGLAGIGRKKFFQKS